MNDKIKPKVMMASVVVRKCGDALKLKSKPILCIVTQLIAFHHAKYCMFIAIVTVRYTHIPIVVAN